MPDDIRTKTKLMKGGRGSTVELQANNKTDWKADLARKQEAKSMHATEEEDLPSARDCQVLIFGVF